MSIVLLVNNGLYMVIVAYVSNHFIQTHEVLAVTHVHVELNIGEFAKTNPIAIGDSQFAVFTNRHIDDTIFIIAIRREKRDIECCILCFVLITCNRLWRNC